MNERELDKVNSELDSCSFGEYVTLTRIQGRQTVAGKGERASEGSDRPDGMSDRGSTYWA